jgi:hypothetical protein
VPAISCCCAHRCSPRSKCRASRSSTRTVLPLVVRIRVHVANDAGGKKALHALPPHRFVVHRDGGSVRYLYAEPNHCVCIFIGSEAAYRNYRDILARPVDQPDTVAPDYKTQASALLYGDPYDWNTLNQPTSIADYLRAYY